jgi:hypothetical protein
MSHFAVDHEQKVESRDDLFEIIVEGVIHHDVDSWDCSQLCYWLSCITVLDYDWKLMSDCVRHELIDGKCALAMKAIDWESLGVSIQLSNLITHCFDEYKRRYDKHKYDEIRSVNTKESLPTFLSHTTAASIEPQGCNSPKLNDVTYGQLVVLGNQVILSVIIVFSLIIDNIYVPKRIKQIIIQIP